MASLVRGCVLVWALIVFPSLGFSQSKEIYEAYNMYRSVPATSAAQLGAINEGFFDSDGMTLRVGQKICSPSPEMAITKEQMEQCAPQAGIVAKSESATQFAFVAALKALFGADVSAQKFSVSEIAVSNVCIHELSLEDSMTVLDRPSCLRALKVARQGYSNVPLSQRLSEPGKWLVMFQTTRLMQADVTYKLIAKQGIGVDAGLKDLAIKTVGRLVNASATIKHASNSEIEVEAKGAFFALGPRYYEELYLPEAEAVAVRRNIETLARRDQSRRSPDDRSVMSAIKELEASETAADARLSKRLQSIE